MMSELRLDQLTVTYPDSAQPVLKQLSLKLQQGEKVLLLGASGSGKSTLALAMNGIIPQAVEAHVEGNVSLDGIALAQLEKGLAARRIGILFQDPEAQCCMLYADDEVAFGLENLRMPTQEMERLVDESLDRVGLWQRKTDNIQSFSGGMKQKLGLAGLYAMNPDVWILDEPTANLDPAGAEEVISLVMEQAEKLGKTVLCIEHKLDLCVPHMDRVIVLGYQGRILCDGAPRVVFHQHADTLKQHGIWLPKICEMARQLEKSGFDWPIFPLTMEEWKQGLASFVFSGEQENSAYVNQAADRSAAGTKKLLSFDQVAFAYKQRSVFSELSFDIFEGDFVAITGPNGAGKSTLGQLVLKLLKPSQGEIYLSGEPLSRMAADRVYQQVGYVFQNPEHQFVKDRVFDELAYGYHISGQNQEQWLPRVEKLLQQFGLEEHRDRHPYQLSQGQKRRLSVATMLTRDQSMLILDEPTFGQDQAYTEALMGLLVDLKRQGKTIVMITHDMELVYQYADQVLLLAGGGLAFQGNVSAFFKTLEQPGRAEQYRLRLPLSYLLEASLREAVEVTDHA